MRPGLARLAVAAWLLHGVVLRGIDTQGKVQLTNNWGTRWGVHGDMWMSRADFAHLMASGGQARRWERA